MTPLLYAALLALPLCGQGPDVVWNVNLPRARQEAKDQGRPLLLYFTTADCFWCKKLEAGPFHDAAAKAEMRRYVCVKVEGDLNFARSMGVRAFPTLLRLDPDGAPRGRQTGYLDAAALARWLRAD